MRSPPACEPADGGNVVGERPRVHAVRRCPGDACLRRAPAPRQFLPVCFPVPLSEMVFVPASLVMVATALRGPFALGAKA